MALGSSEHVVPWDSFIEESRMQYLRRMNLNEQFDDHIILQAMFELFNRQVIVVSTLNHGITLIREMQLL